MTLAAAVSAARAAGQILRKRRPKHIDSKGAVDLVTEVDRACELVIRDILARLTPHIPVYGEEGGGAEAAAIRWVVDPLDGTTNFVHGFPYFCTSIALERNGQSEIGVVYDPVADDLFTAVRGRGAYRNGQPMYVSTCSEMNDALLATGFPYDRRQRVDLYLAIVREALMRCQGLRRGGAAALDLAGVACGRLDGYWEFSLQPWDVAAGTLLVLEAGGKVSDHSGQPVLDKQALEPAATNGALHTSLISLIAAGQQNR